MVLAALAPMVSAHNQAPAAGDLDKNVILNCGGLEAEVGDAADGYVAYELPVIGEGDGNALPAVCALGTPHTDNDRLSSFGAIVETRGGVSGRYVGSAFFANAVGGSESSLFPLATVPNPPNPTLGPATFTLLPGGLFSSLTGPFCDFEVQGDGRHVDQTDETTVDAFVGAPTATIGNGLWDDGGQGGACHTTGYNAAPDGATFTYNGGDNTPGCPAGQFARAEDAVSGDSVWIATSCDLSHPVLGASPNWVTCPENAMIRERDWTQSTGCFNDVYGCSLPQYLTGQPVPAPGPGFPPTAADLPAIESCTTLTLTQQLACNITFSFPPTQGELQTCATTIVLCEPPITTSNCLPPPTTACGTDNGADVTRFGKGGAHNHAGDTETLGNGGTGRPIYDNGVPFLGSSDSNGNRCSNANGQALVSALTAVHVEVPHLQGLADGSFAPGDDGVGVNLSLATTGWISQTTSGGGFNLPECSDGIDNDGDGYTDYHVTIDHSPGAHPKKVWAYASDGSYVHVSKVAHDRYNVYTFDSGTRRITFVADLECGSLIWTSFDWVEFN